jgi:hypothetical protein
VGLKQGKPLLKQRNSTMTITEEQKRKAANNSNPLYNAAGVLETVLSYVGPGHCLFVAPGSKWWKEMYFGVDRHQLTVDAGGSREKDITCVSQMTLYSSVFTSPSRVMHAYQNGVDCTSERYQRAASEYADVVLLAKAHWLGMEYTATTMAAAAHRNKVAVVHYLNSEGCAWAPLLLMKALSSGYFELVHWCYKHGCSL